jgi:hypothetical protein
MNTGLVLQSGAEGERTELLTVPQISASRCGHVLLWRMDALLRRVDARVPRMDASLRVMDALLWAMDASR